MGSLKGIKYTELREYDDPKNPNSDYKVFLPTTGITAVYNEISKKTLY